jgi:hypothetical protein
MQILTPDFARRYELPTLFQSSETLGDYVGQAGRLRLASPERPGATQRLEGSQTPPRRLDSGRLRRAGRFGARATIHRICSATSAAGMCARQAAPANNPTLSSSTGRA